ncbi:MAG: 16S rRNA (adenine(1518)-N(6)/adenine(1519)-N(6))-dimethyltransferase RsmA [Thermodesulfobacteriota bacterium]
MVSIRKELAEYGLIPQKGWGQHFLIDQNILTKVIQTAQVEKKDVVLEVGPGLGEMTIALARQAKQVIAIEIDPKLVELLKKKLVDFPNIDVVKGDILALDFKKSFSQLHQRVKVVANLPYQISTPLLFHFIDSRKVFSTLTLMLQREVAERIVATPGSKAYGPLSIFMQLFLDLSIRFFIKPSAFFPPPKVESAVVHLVWREKPMVELGDERWFKKVVKGCFSYRRKTLINGLKHSGLSLPYDIEQRMEKIGIDPRRRPETLSIQEFARLANSLRY